MSSAVQETRPNHMTRRVLERQQNTALARASTHPKHIQPRKWGRVANLMQQEWMIIIQHHLVIADCLPPRTRAAIASCLPYLTGTCGSQVDHCESPWKIIALLTEIILGAQGIPAPTLASVYGDDLSTSPQIQPLCGPTHLDFEAANQNTLMVSIVGNEHRFLPQFMLPTGGWWVFTDPCR